MSKENINMPLGVSGLKGPARDFADFCEEEKQRRLSAGEDFDEKRFDQVVDLVMVKLKALEVGE
jgi:hypothetical protein